MAKKVISLVALIFMSVAMAYTFPSIWDEPLLWDRFTYFRTLFFLNLFLGLNTALVKD